MRTRILLLAAAATLTAATAVVLPRLVPHRDDYEEPAYEVVARSGDLQIRRYAPTIEARVTVRGSRRQATQQGFRILAGYIFGGNTAQAEVAMTTPVSATPTDRGGSQRIDMTTPVSATPASGEASQRIDRTAPVSATADEEGSWVVAFTMPSAWTLDTLPTPDDDRIALVEVEGHTAAVWPFSGWAREGVVDRAEQAFREALQPLAFEATGAPTLAQFDPPWVLGPWRRNELQIPVVARGEGS